MSAQRFRTESDYDDLFVADKEQAENQLNNARKFLTMSKEFISNKK